MMRAFLSKPKVTKEVTPTWRGECVSVGEPHRALSATSSAESQKDDSEIFTEYISDVEDDDEEIEEPAVEPGDEILEWEDVSESPFHVQTPPSLKRRRHDIPICVARKRRRLEVRDELQQALIAIEKLIASKKKVFQAGRNGLQEYRARAIQSHLHMVLHNGRKHIEASERAAESQGFAARWGGRLVR